MSTKIISSRQEVDTFLKSLKAILVSDNFDIDEDLDILPKKKKESPIDPYTTQNTLLALGFDSEDIVYELLSLSDVHYMETFIDDKDCSWPPFYAFGKNINTKDVYIKVKIRDKQNNKVFCVSFHFARYPFSGNFPYA